jgi:translation initiation factor 2 subunit 2
MEYKKLLEKAIKQLPEKVVTKERFEIPKVVGHLQGNKTVISNFLHIADMLGRDTNHVLKFILKELATPGEIKNKEVIIGTKISASRINQKIQQYAEEFVICKECGKPDTKLIKEGDYSFIRCTACGARHPVRTKI